MTVDGAFVYVCVKDFEQTVACITRFFPVDPDDRVIMELQCSSICAITVILGYITIPVIKKMALLKV